VIISYVEAPDGFEFNKHYHPEEEFLYVMEDSGIVLFKDKSKVEVTKGEVLNIPYEAVHTMLPGPDGIKV
jgi:mannose-6-phosphate isomerase-like protein (cupin superfamily)